MWQTLHITEPAQTTLWQHDLSRDAVWFVTIFESAQAAHVKGIQAITVVNHNKGCKCAKKLGTKNNKSKEGRQEKNGRVKGRDRSVDDFD